MRRKGRTARLVFRRERVAFESDPSSEGHVEGPWRLAGRWKTGCILELCAPRVRGRGVGPRAGGEVSWSFHTTPGTNCIERGAAMSTQFRQAPQDHCL